MIIRAKRAFYGDERGVKAGQQIEVSETRGKALIANGLAEEVKEASVKQDPNEKRAAEAAAKKAAAPKNKKAQEAANKATPSAEAK